MVTHKKNWQYKKKNRPLERKEKKEKNRLNVEHNPQRPTNNTQTRIGDCIPLCLFHNNEVLHNVKAVAIWLQSQLFPALCLNQQVAILIDAKNGHLLIASADQSHSCITAIARENNSQYRKSIQYCGLY